MNLDRQELFTNFDALITNAEERLKNESVLRHGDPFFKFINEFKMGLEDYNDVPNLRKSTALDSLEKSLFKLTVISPNTQISDVKNIFEPFLAQYKAYRIEQTGNKMNAVLVTVSGKPTGKLKGTVTDVIHLLQKGINAEKELIEKKNNEGIRKDVIKLSNAFEKVLWPQRRDKTPKYDTTEILTTEMTNDLDKVVEVFMENPDLKNALELLEAIGETNDLTVATGGKRGRKKRSARRKRTKKKKCEDRAKKNGPSRKFIKLQRRLSYEK